MHLPNVFHLRERQERGRGQVVLGAAQLRRFVVFVIDGSLTHTPLSLSRCSLLLCRLAVALSLKLFPLFVNEPHHIRTQTDTDERPLSLSHALSHRSGVCVGV